MKKPNLLYMLVALLVAVSYASCDKKESEPIDEDVVYSSSGSSALVSSFSLNANTKILAHLDSINFCIDQEKGIIYNPDSLPMGTDVSKLLCTVKFGATTVSSASFVVGGGKVIKQDTTINYTASMTDSIDFTGHVTLNVTSADGQGTMSYRIYVNVHNENPDSLLFPLAARRNLPASADDNYDVGMAQMGGLFYSMINNSNGRYVATATTPDGKWSSHTVSLPFVPVENSLTATNQALYILDTTGNLYTSTNGEAWTSTGVVWHSIIGGYGDRVLGVMLDGGTMNADEYPRRSGYSPVALPARFPITGRSQLIIENSEWTVGQTALLFGGRDASGKMVNTTWGYDGNTWGEFNGVSGSAIPALEGATLFAYTTYDLNKYSLHATPRHTLIVMGGRFADGKLNRKTYVSRDLGITWLVAASCMEMPAYMPSFVDAKAFVCSATYSSKAPKRVSKPINEWDVPFVYIVGGKDGNGYLLNNVWKGVISRLTYKPLY